VGRLREGEGGGRYTVHGTGRLIRSLISHTCPVLRYAYTGLSTLHTVRCAAGVLEVSMV